jgi:hypothetical protein
VKESEASNNKGKERGSKPEDSPVIYSTGKNGKGNKKPVSSNAKKMD